MSDIVVNVTNAGAANVAVSNGSTVNAVVGSGGSVNVSLGSISPGNATVVSGTLTINSTTTLAAGTPAYVANNGTAYAAKLDIGIPAGPATNVVVGKVSTLSASSNATVTGTANGSTLTLDFGIPAGQGGSNGTAGVNGVTPSFAIGNVSTLAAGSTANVTLTATNGGANVTLDFGLPRGADGNGTGSNLTLSNATPANLGTPAAGASNAAARADHVHQLPQLVSSLNGLAGGVNLVAGANITITAGSGNLTIAAAGGGLAANAAIDGGFYVGEIVGGITFLTQPQSQTLNSSTTLTLGNVAAGTELLALSGNIGDVTGFNGTLYAQRIDGNKAGLIYSTDNGATWEWTNITRTNSAAQYGFGQYVTSGFANGATVVRYLSVGPEMLMASNGTRAVVVTAITDNVGGFSDSAQSLSRVYVADAVANLANAVTINAYGLRSVCYLPTAGRWAWTDWSGFIATSSDGTNWTDRSQTLSAAALGRGYYGSTVHAVNGRFITYQPPNVTQWLYSWYSTDGIGWTATQQTFSLTTAASSPTRLVGFSTEQAAAGTTPVRVTSDGVTWQLYTLPVRCYLLRYAAGLFWAFPTSSSSDYLTSPDGATWTVRSDATTSPKTCGGGSSVKAFFPRLDNSILSAAVGVSAASANLTVFASASGGAAVSYQWQSSLDAGTTWANVSNATSTTLALSGLTTANSGTRYRASASAVGASTAYSQSATLTITG